MLSETNLANLTALVFVGSMICWFYMRLLVFPWIAWWVIVQDSDTGNAYIFPFFGYGLFCLVFMHAYWFAMFVKILHYYLTKGKADDLIEEDLTELKEEQYQVIGGNPQEDQKV